MASKESAGGECFPVPASENEFSKYSGVVVLAGRNRPRFAIQAHCGLLVTSMSPNCCFLNGILRKSHFPPQSSGENIPRPPALCPPPPPFRPSHALPFTEWTASYIPIQDIIQKHGNQIYKLRAWQERIRRHGMRGMGKGKCRAVEGRDRRWLDFRCFVKGNEIFLIFRPIISNLVTWMSPKARNEPGWRIAGGCVRLLQFYRNI